MSIESPDFADFATEFEDWYYVATDLLAAAEALEPRIHRYWRIERKREQTHKKSSGFPVFVYEPDPRGVHFMLMAYALENLCKGVLVLRHSKQFKQEIARTGKLPKKILTHNRANLFAEIGFRSSKSDLELVNRLERSAVWSARYPVPRQENDRTVFSKTVGGKEIVPMWHDEDDLETVKNLVKRLKKFVAKQRGF